VVERWNAAYPDGGPLGLAGWQAAFMAVGLPGLLLALWVFTLREPVRGQSEGLAAAQTPQPFRTFLLDLLEIIPPFTLIGALLRGTRALLVNLAAAIVIAVPVLALVWLTGDAKQWIALGIGVYAVSSWMSALRRRDPPTFALLLGTPTFIAVVLAYSLNAFVAYAVGFWAAPYALRELGLSPAEAGIMLGSIGAASGFIGTTLGGIVADRLRLWRAQGRIAVVLFGAIAPIAPIVIAFTTDNVALFYAMLFVSQAFASSALGASAASLQDLVLPRMRGTATATFFLGTTLIGLALGPYIAGRVSSMTDSLSIGVLSLLVVSPITIAAGLYAWRNLGEAEASREDRARAAGEVI
jgi:hypothetical protein